MDGSKLLGKGNLGESGVAQQYCNTWTWNRTTSLPTNLWPSSILS